MSIKKSGLWCDLCRSPILDMPYWNISLNGKKGNYHSCNNCKESWGKKKKEQSE